MDTYKSFWLKLVKTPGFAQELLGSETVGIFQVFQDIFVKVH